LRQVRPSRIYVAADGPRPNNATDAERCRECRAVINEIDWSCEIQRRFSDANQGCRWGPANAMDWFFQQETEGIILEDDILPDPSFFPFCQELLARYRNAPQVGCICGYNFLPRTGANYVFSRISLTWGWATWRDRWQQYAAVCADFEKNLADVPLRSWLSRHDTQDMKRKIREAYQEDHVWDFLWSFTLWSREMLSVLPAQSLTSNMGIGREATHTFVETPFMRVEVKPVAFPLQHPPAIRTDDSLDREIFQSLLHTPTVSERAFGILKSGRPLGRIKEVVARRMGRTKSTPQASRS
jgi:hypothetical protein